MVQFESSGAVPVDVDALVSAVRTSLGDDLRRVVYFTPSSFAVCYARQDLSDAAADATEQLVEIERVGFAERPVRDAVTRHETGTEIGPYAFTVRFHERGFVMRVLVGDHGVLATADEMDVRAFEEAASAVRGLLG